MIGRAFVLVVTAGLLLGPDVTAAQSRFSVHGGALVPLGDFGDWVEPSPRFGIRSELQSMNVLGQRKLLSFHVEASYAALSHEAAVESALLAQGSDEDPSLLEVGLGVRAYSRVAPFFVTGGAGYARYRPGGDLDTEHGLDLNAGLGFLVPLGLFLVEVEARLHNVIFEDDDLRYLTAGAALGLPI
jgi:hypothetical protein